MKWNWRNTTQRFDIMVHYMKQYSNLTRVESVPLSDNHRMFSDQLESLRLPPVGSQSEVVSSKCHGDRDRQESGAWDGRQSLRTTTKSTLILEYLSYYKLSLIKTHLLPLLNSFLPHWMVVAAGYPWDRWRRAGLLIQKSASIWFKKCQFE